MIAEILDAVSSIFAIVGGVVTFIGWLQMRRDKRPPEA
jgi:hypothetical protein